ncbi:glutathione S-transferase family protein [Chitinimonas koreensis]|uniref:glutathione S-transferase family protein n=1 Tax=Chitinimonas koreensis TaxID=356302 RepID=UPI0004014C98|nr:glutathione S-transferase family protein [Chitinimonas koreensis]QNM97054.1 glutathione S-transferase family protein [Chitinimonas koreensis]
MYQLHIANKNYSSWSLRPWLLLSELGIAFDERLIPFDAGGANWAPFRRFAPNGRVPCLHDGDTVVWDSLAIVEYLAERHAGVWPADGAARTWARCAAAEMHAGFGALRQRCSMNCGVRIRLHAVPAELQRDLDRIAELWNEGLARFGGPFLAGAQFSAVDAFFAPVAFRLESYGLQLGEAADAYAARLRALPGMQRWLAAALAEPWREPGHEAEALAAGTLLEDRRLAAG